MAYPILFSGNRFWFNRVHCWNGACPYHHAHRKQMGLPHWRGELMFEKWHKRSPLHEKGQPRHDRKPYRLYWLLHQGDVVG